MILLEWKEENDMLVLKIDEWLKIERLKRGVEKDLFLEQYIGFAIAKKDVYQSINCGDAGLLTAYLPERDNFAIKFPGQWHTFHVKEYWFLDHFTVIWD